MLFTSEPTYFWFPRPVLAKRSIIFRQSRAMGQPLAQASLEHRFLFCFVFLQPSFWLLVRSVGVSLKGVLNQAQAKAGNVGRPLRDDSRCGLAA